MSDLENQMGLFEIGGPAPSYSPPARRQPAQPKPAAKAARPAALNRAGSGTKTPPRTAHPPQKGVSGLVPEGDVRLTANIRQDLHLKLKIASAYRRTTIGEIIEELIEKYV